MPSRQVPAIVPVARSPLVAFASPDLVPAAAYAEAAPPMGTEGQHATPRDLTCACVRADGDSQPACAPDRSSAVSTRGSNAPPPPNETTVVARDPQRASSFNPERSFSFSTTPRFSQTMGGAPAAGGDGGRSRGYEPRVVSTLGESSGAFSFGTGKRFVSIDASSREVCSLLVEPEEL